MAKNYVEIDESTFNNLKSVAKGVGCSSVEELLKLFAKNFSTGCSVTLSKASSPDK